MLQIKIDNQLVDISGISFTWVRKSPIFYPDQGSHSYTFSFPNTVKNNKIFGFPGRLQQYISSSRTFNITISFDGIMIIDDRLIVNRTSQDSIEGYLLTDTGNFNELIKGKLIRDIDFGDDFPLGDDQQEILDAALGIVAKSYPDACCQFPSLFNSVFYGPENEKNPDYPGIINLFKAMEGQYAANDIHKDPEKDNIQTLVPMLYLAFVLDKIFSHLGFYAEGDFFLDTELSELLIYNNYALDRKEKKYYTRAERTIPQLIEDQGTVIFDDDYTSPNEDNDDVYDRITGEYTISNKGYHHIYSGIMISDTLHVIQGRILLDGGIIDMVEIQSGDLSEHNYVYYAEDSDVGKKLKYYVVDGEGSDTFRVTIGKLIITQVSLSNLNQLAKTITPSNHVPEIEISTLLAAIKYFLCAALFIDPITRQAKLSLVKNILASPFSIDLSDNLLPPQETETSDKKGYQMEFSWPASDAQADDNFKDYSGYSLLGDYDTLNDLPVSSQFNKIARVRHINAIYIFTVDENNLPGWQKLTDDFLPYIIGDGNENIAPDAATLTMMRSEDVTAILPVISQPGTSFGFATGKNEFGLHLLFYRGMQPDENNHDYPLASPVHFDSQGNSIGNYDLRWDRNNGLWETFWKDFTDRMESAKTVIVYKQMHAADIRALDFSKKYRIQGIEYLIKELEVTINERGIQAAKLTLITI